MPEGKKHQMVINGCILYIYITASLYLALHWVEICTRGGGEGGLIPKLSHLSSCSFSRITSLSFWATVIFRFLISSSWPSTWFFREFLSKLTVEIHLIFSYLNVVASKMPFPPETGFAFLCCLFLQLPLPTLCFGGHGAPKFWKVSISPLKY